MNCKEKAVMLREGKKMLVHKQERDKDLNKLLFAVLPHDQSMQRDHDKQNTPETISDC